MIFIAEYETSRPTKRIIFQESSKIKYYIYFDVESNQKHHLVSAAYILLNNNKLILLYASIHLMQT